ncbi:uncharacterized protein LOC129728271 [Wyeomyia smithii]|uniref:uncharacterized protein LOC129728271 n=1 Tax=Wyeomyia smithii TaxID=174621 RepID=UPI002467B4BB|nr:uncharacterized protein LOC129728271 [Wyeomyia smithii]
MLALSDYPPTWDDPGPNIDWGIKKLCKAGEIPNITQNIFREHVQRHYSNHIQIYTDGSYTPNAIGIGVAGQLGNKHRQISAPSSSFSAEAAALYLGVKMAPSNNQTVIFTGSASVLAALQSGTHNHPWIQRLEVYRNDNVTFCWVPAHCGIRGNEEADRLANLGRSEKVWKSNVPGPDLKRFITDKIQNRWNEQWRNTTDNFTRKIKHTTEKWTDRSDWREQKVLSRLRIGHTRITHGHRIDSRTPTPTCEICGIRLTVEHILMSCPKYEHQRNKHKFPCNIREILSNDASAETVVISFLKENQIYENI